MKKILAWLFPKTITRIQDEAVEESEAYNAGECYGYNRGVDDARAMTPAALDWRIKLEEITRSAIADPWRIRWALNKATSSLETGRQFSELAFWEALKEAATMTEEACRAEVEK